MRPAIIRSSANPIAASDVVVPLRLQSCVRVFNPLETLADFPERDPMPASDSSRHRTARKLIQVHSDTPPSHQ